MKSDDSSKIPADVLAALADKANRTQAEQSDLAGKQQRLLTKLRSNKTRSASTSSPQNAAQPTPKESAPAQPETGFEPLLQRIASRAQRFTPEDKEMAAALGFSTGESLQSDDTK